MKNYDCYYESKPKNYRKYLLLALLGLFCLIIITFALNEVSNFYNDKPTVMRILINSFESSDNHISQQSANDKSGLTKSEVQKQVKNSEELFHLRTSQEALNSDRQARALTDEKSNSTDPKSNSYYEEQTPVVVYSKTDAKPSIAYRQMAEVPPKQDNDEQDPYSKAPDEDYESSDDYLGQPELRSRQEEQQSYYRKQIPQDSQLSQPYYRQPPPQSYYRQQQEQPYYKQQSFPFNQYPVNPQYYDDFGEDFPGPNNDDQQNSEEARSTQYHDYPNYYRQQPYATPPPMTIAGRDSNNRLTDAKSSENRNMQMATKAKATPQNRDPFPSYTADYEYMPPHSHYPPSQQHRYRNRPIPQQMQLYRTPSTDAPAQQKEDSGQQLNYLTMFKTLKTMWDLYQSFTSSWNTIAERRNREEEMANQKYKQMQPIRINSKKPPKFSTRKNATATTKNPRQKTTTTTMMEPLANSAEIYSSSGEQEKAELQVKKQPLAKVEPRKAMKGAKVKSKEEDGLRDKRQAADASMNKTDVVEGRYIKGDPLKGYYDFVITEGSYKFWAVFQVGTAILIIYSTFAAIYYSKVNPLVSDYDYTDYLGGARSLIGGDLDFVDDDGGEVKKAQAKNWLEWLPRTGHSLKFILDAIDKLPTDHAAEEGTQDDFYKNKRSEDEENADGIQEYDAEFDVEDADNFKDKNYSTESVISKERENFSELETLKESKQDNMAM